MKDGHYTILHISHHEFAGQDIGSFDIIDGQITNRKGLAEEVLSDGPADGYQKFYINRLSNGYRRIEWTRPTADPKKNPPVDPDSVTSVEGQ